MEEHLQPSMACSDPMPIRFYHAVFKGIVVQLVCVMLCAGSGYAMMAIVMMSERGVVSILFVSITQVYVNH